MRDEHDKRSIKNEGLQKRKEPGNKMVQRGFLSVDGMMLCASASLEGNRDITPEKKDHTGKHLRSSELIVGYESRYRVWALFWTETEGSTLETQLQKVLAHSGWVASGCLMLAMSFCLCSLCYRKQHALIMQPHCALDFIFSSERGWIVRQRRT